MLKSFENISKYLKIVFKMCENLINFGKEY